MPMVKDIGLDSVPTYDVELTPVSNFSMRISCASVKAGKVKWCKSKQRKE